MCFSVCQNLLCSECGDEFVLMNQLTLHLEEHRRELSGTRVFTCKTCGAEFPLAIELKEHNRTHAKIRCVSVRAQSCVRAVCLFRFHFVSVALLILSVTFCLPGYLLLSNCLSACLSASAKISVLSEIFYAFFLSFCLLWSVYLSVRQFLRLSPFISLSVHLCIFLPACLSVYLTLSV